MRIFHLLLTISIFTSYTMHGHTYIMPGRPENTANRVSSYPFVSGDTFREIADHIIDETRIPFDPDLVQPNDTIFLKTDALSFFFNTIHPLIKNKYILITHNSDHSAPAQFRNYLDDPKIKAWFAQNTDYVHPKLFSIPIGLANKHWPHGNVDLIKQAQHQKNNRIAMNLYMNFEIGSNAPERSRVYNFFKTKPFCHVSGHKPWKNYLLEMAQAKYVISPPGNGLDCHRTWEALYMGSIPIVLKSTLHQLYENIPVLVINSWDEVTEEFLSQKYVEINHTQHNMEKLYADYWFDLIQAMKNS